MLKQLQHVLSNWFSPASAEPTPVQAPPEEWGEGIVEETIQPGQAGRVQYQGSCWYARCPEDAVLVKGRTVRVVGVRNVTLVVEPKRVG